MRNEAPGILAEWAALAQARSPQAVARAVLANIETRRVMGVSVRPLFPSEAPGLTFEQRVELALAEAREILREADQ